MKVIISESSVTLWAFPLSRVIPGLQTFKTEHVKAFGQDGVLLTCITTRTRQLGLKKKKGNGITGKQLEKNRIISFDVFPLLFIGKHLNSQIQMTAYKSTS